MTTFIVNRQNTQVRSMFVQESGTKVNMTLKKSFLPKNIKGDWSVSLEEASCNFTIPMLKSQELLYIRARNQATTIPPNYVVSPNTFSAGSTTFTCNDVYSLQQFVFEFRSFVDTFNNRLICFGYNPPATQLIHTTTGQVLHKIRINS